MTCGDQGQGTEGAPRAALHDLRSCSVATPTTIVRVSVRALQVCFAAQSGRVLICLTGWPDGVLGRDLCRLIT